MMKKLLFCMMVCTLLAFGCNVQPASGADKTITVTWEKDPVEPDLAGFNLELYFGQGTELIVNQNIPYLGQDVEFTYESDVQIQLPEGQETQVCARVRVYDSYNNYSDWADWTEYPEACVTADLQPPGKALNIKVIFKVVE